MKKVDRTDTVFKKCSHKIVGFENYLTGNAKPLPFEGGEGKFVEISHFTRRRGVINMLPENSIRIMHIGERSGAHAVILVKNNMFQKGWSIFDSNGKKGFIASIFRLYDANRKKGSDKDITVDYLEASPSTALNPGYFTVPAKTAIPDHINPGFCGVIGIIFMVYFKKHHSNPNWLKNWQNVMKCLAKPYSIDNGKTTKYSVKVATDVLNAIHTGGSNHKKLENTIMDIVESLCNVANTNNAGDGAGANAKAKTKANNSSNTRKKRNSNKVSNHTMKTRSRK